MGSKIEGFKGAAESNGAESYPALIENLQERDQDRNWTSRPEIYLAQQRMRMPAERGGQPEDLMPAQLADGMKRLKLATVTQESMRRLVDDLDGVSGVRMQRDGMKLDVTIDRKDKTTIEKSGDEQRPLEVCKVEIAKELKFKLSRDNQNNITLSGIDGLHIKGKMHNGSEPQDIELDVTQGKLVQVAGKSMVEFSISIPGQSGQEGDVIKFPIRVPLSREIPPPKEMK